MTHLIGNLRIRLARRVRSAFVVLVSLMLFGPTTRASEFGVLRLVQHAECACGTCDADAAPRRVGSGVAQGVERRSCCARTADDAPRASRERPECRCNLVPNVPERDDGALGARSVAVGARGCGAIAAALPIAAAPWSPILGMARSGASPPGWAARAGPAVRALSRLGSLRL